MAFTDQQITELLAPLRREYVKQRAQAGRQLSYVEGWHVVSESNRIFGFSEWCSETLDVTKVSEHQRPVGNGQGWGVTYTARVRITVYAGGTTVVREGIGAGHGIDRDLGLAHESAIKEAETDARKRALMTFGNPFGLALYDKEQRNVIDAEPVREALPAPPPETKPMSAYRARKTGVDKRFKELTQLVRSAASTEALRELRPVIAKEIQGWPSSYVEHLRGEYESRLYQLRDLESKEAT
ncbi:MAG TPA: RAD52 family DNA repair protein [Hyphomicrobiaceae bacterium]|nr:RAD52 family DNA repair protein [Hyphomicrobiaceae bacterium]